VPAGHAVAINVFDPVRPPFRALLECKESDGPLPRKSQGYGDKGVRKRVETEPIELRRLPRLKALSPSDV
jgi:hypothetical protein